VCRTLSYEGSSFTMSEEQLTAEQRAVYDEAVVFMHRLMAELQDAAGAQEVYAAHREMKKRLKAREKEERRRAAIVRGDYRGAEASDSDDERLSSESDSDDEETGLSGKAVWRYFWGQHQRFFMSLCAAMKVRGVFTSVNGYSVSSCRAKMALRAPRWRSRRWCARRGRRSRRASAS
jgi:hypothetical protein